jgi:hypothetical protein
MSGRTVWLAAGSLVTVAGLTFGTMQTVSGIAHREERLERSFDAAGIEAVRIDGEGTVRVVGADVDSITVSMRISHGLRETGHSERAVGGVLVLDNSCPVIMSAFCQVDYDVEVPAGLRVEVDNDDGRIELRDLAGPIDVDGDNGPITATGLRSDRLSVSNDKGSIQLDLVEPPEHVQVDNDNGTIDVALPDVPEGYAVETRNDNGDVDVTVRRDPRSPRTIDAENDNGAIVIHPR